MDPFAVAQDFTDRGFTNGFGSVEVLGNRLAAASRYVRARVPDVDVRIAAGVLDPELVVDVVCAMVARSTPGDTAAGVGAVQETAGPFSRSLTFANPTGDLYLTAAELRLLGGGRVQRAGSVDLLPPVPDPGLVEEL